MNFGDESEIIALIYRQLYVNKIYFRPAEVDLLIGNSEKAKQILKWEPKYTLQQIIKDMIQNEKGQ